MNQFYCLLIATLVHISCTAFETPRKEHLFMPNDLEEEEDLLNGLQAIRKLFETTTHTTACTSTSDHNAPLLDSNESVEKEHTKATITTPFYTWKKTDQPAHLIKEQIIPAKQAEVVYHCTHYWNPTPSSSAPSDDSLTTASDRDIFRKIRAAHNVLVPLQEKIQKDTQQLHAIEQTITNICAHALVRYYKQQVHEELLQHWSDRYPRHKKDMEQQYDESRAQAAALLQKNYEKQKLALEVENSKILKYISDITYKLQACDDAIKRENNSIQHLDPTYNTAQKKGWWFSL